MITKIRSNVFETNSSSMHSIAVLKKHESATTESGTSNYFTHNGMRRLYDDDLCFGSHPFEILYSMMDKVRYVIASYLGRYYCPPDDDEADKFLEGEIYPIIRKFIPDFVGFKFEVDYERRYFDPSKPEIGYSSRDSAIIWTGKDKDNTSGYSIRYRDSELISLVEDTERSIEIKNYGNIDHQSQGLLQEFLELEGITLEQFLTDRAYIVIIDGDEYRDFERYLAAGIIHKEDFEKVYQACSGWLEDIF